MTIVALALIVIWGQRERYRGYDYPTVEDEWMCDI